MDPSGAFRKIETHELEASNFDAQATILRHTFYPDPPSFTALGVREDELNALIADEQVMRDMKERSREKILLACLGSVGEFQAKPRL